MFFNKINKEIVAGIIGTVAVSILSGIASYIWNAGTELKLAILIPITGTNFILALLIWVKISSYIRRQRPAQPEISMRGFGRSVLYKKNPDGKVKIEIPLPFIILLKGVYPGHNWLLEVEAAYGLGIQLHKDITRKDSGKSVEGLTKRYKIEASLDGIQAILVEKVWIDTNNFRSEGDFVVFKFKLYEGEKLVNSAEYEIPVYDIGTQPSSKQEVV